MIRLTSARPFTGLIAASTVAFGLFMTAAQAQQPGGGSRLTGSFSDWSVYTSGQGNSKFCYAVTQPKVRLPAGLNRDPAYLFVSTRPSEKIRNEVSIVFGFPARPGQDAEALVDGKPFSLVTKGENGWVKDPSQEGAVLAAFRGGSKLIVKSTSARGSSLSDEYSLAGITAALQQLARECP